MKKQILTLLSISVVIAILLNVREIHSNVGGAPAGYSGSPGDGKNCTLCHTDFAVIPQTGWITSDIPVNGYLPGITYNITATATKTGVTKFGFELSPQNTGGTLMGTLLANSTTQLVGFGKYITHIASSTTGSNDTHSWSFQWKAPSTSSGNVTFYAAFNATDNDDTDVGDQIYTSSLSVSENNSVSVNISSVTHVTCNGACTGSATASGSGGSSPYTFSWNTTPNQTTTTATGLCAGNYIVTITDANSNTGTTTATISEPSVVTASIPTQTNVLCFGGSSGSATAEGAGGVPSYTYSWSTTPTQTSITATGLTTGIYTVSVTDANLCPKTASVTITQPGSIVSASTTSQTDVLCYGAGTGTVTAVGGGGTSSYTYSWNTTPSQTTATATGLIAGTYTVTVRDSNLCTVTASSTVTITQPASAVTVTASATDANCGVADGTASASAGGGTGVPTYSWNDLAGSTTVTATGLIAGAYTVTVTDSNGCTASASTNVNNSGAPVVNISSQINVTGCYGDSTGRATVTATGGTGNLTYSWSTTPVQTATIATGLTAGNHTVTVTDSVGCKQIATVTITQPSALIASSSSTPILCKGGSSKIMVTAVGGTSPYTGTGTFTVKDSTYNYIVTDSKGCITETIIKVTEPVALTVTVSLTPILCKGGSTTIGVSASGGTSPYTGTGTFTVKTGTQNYTVIDDNGCSASKSITVTEPTLLTITSLISTPDTSGQKNGTITLVSAGGTPPYSYSWSNGGTQPSIRNLASIVYSVTVTDKNFCTVNNTIPVGVYNSIESEISGSLFSIKTYPNPTRNNFFIDITTPTDRTFELRIINITGQVLQKEVLNIPAGQTLKNITLKDNYKGMLILELISNNELIRKPLMVID